ncbi:hypothetical protein EIP86_003458 [Pleurotus ostreatoroseus]|nr:hypothetical protein EIP86_003458 [Pleurotus ostreatoroseus]
MPYGEQGLSPVFQTCRQLQLLVDTTPELRYTVELAASNFVNNTNDHFTPLTQRLSLLQEMQMFWKKPHFRPGLPFYCDSSNYHGNLFVTPQKTRDLTYPAIWNALKCVALEPDGTSIKAREWTLDFELGFENFVLDATRNTLVLLNWMHCSGDDNNDWIYA